jgi:hypothetical protein
MPDEYFTQLIQPYSKKTLTKSSPQDDVPW